MHNLVGRLFICLLVLTFSGCAIGNRVQYNTERLAFQPPPATNERVVILAVQDIRPNVLSGTISESNVGIQRSLAGIPWAIKTKSGAPLAQDFGHSIASAYNAVGYKFNHVTTRPTGATTEVLAEARKIGGSPKVLYMLIREWTTENWFSETLNYCLELQALDNAGHTAAKTAQCGVKAIAPSSSGFSSLSEAMGTILRELFMEKEIQQYFAQ